MDSLTALWNLDNEAISLGGILVFRKECELLSQQHQNKGVVFYFVSKNTIVDLTRLPGYVNLLLQSQFRFQFARPNTPIPEIVNWPLSNDHLSRVSFKRIVGLIQKTKRPIALQWSNNLMKEANKRIQAIQSLGFPLIYCLHLKRVGNNSKESNATLENWFNFLSTVTKNKNKAFLLIGDDPIPKSFFQIKGVFSASSLRIPLSTQLAICSLINGFMGMASGICAAAVLSNIPYIVFKHPEHHSEEMKIELAGKDSFDCANSFQKIWRVQDTVQNLHQGWNFIQLL